MTLPQSDSLDRLRVQNITKSFGAFTAVNSVSFSVQLGEVMAIIGPNGAGKTTVFNLLNGNLKPTSGHIYLDGFDIVGRKLYQISRLGISRAFQTTNIFPSFTVIENVLVALFSAKRRSFSLLSGRDKNVTEEAERVLSLVNLSKFASKPANALSHGDQRALEIAIALASSPKVLLLDEPTAGMSPYETQEIVALLKEIVAKQNLTVVLSEHDMEVVFGLANRVTVMEAGRVLAQGTPEEIRSNPEVKRAYLGE